MRLFNCTLMIFVFVQFALTQQEDIEKELFLLPDVMFKAVETPPGFLAAYELRIRQPIDHANPKKGFFFQKAYLSHKGFDKPMVFVTEGYDCGRNITYELTRLLDANQVEVEHRFFGESYPDSLDYKYLTLKQSSADLHHIHDLLRQLYRGKWLSTGISKGGQTSIYYRYFYPADVDVTVPYVAPLNLEREDKRIYTFLDTIGTDECQVKIKALQIRLLKERDSVLPLLKLYCKGARLQFTYLNFEEAFEYTVLEYPFSFWQWGFNCDIIPADTSSVENALLHLLDVVNISFFSDLEIKAYASHYYQAAAEMGYYGYETDDFGNLLKALPLKPNPSAALTPYKMHVEFDSTITLATYKWLQTKGDRFIYIYGGSDTWSATAVPPSANVDALWFFLPGRGHGGARIRNMSPDEKEKMIAALNRWLKLDITLEKKSE
ncbi:MAG: aminopeptidase [Bacteroidales bacterium]|nr:aminopeptidase [Bacteroidales bacterium]